MDEIGSSYEEIYALDPEVEIHAEECQVVLNLITRTLSKVEREALDKVLDLAEIEDVVEHLPRNKSLGLDGLTTAVLLKCWDWLKDECLEVIQMFWRDGILTSNMIKGVIRLIPKSGELSFLKNWRPITLMNLLYKIISKILANRLKQYLSFLVDEEQTGFIAGRRILDNILVLELGENLLKLSV